MSIFGAVPDHEAWVGGSDVELQVPIAPTANATLELVGDEAADYSFVTDPHVTSGDTSVRLKFSPRTTGRSDAKLQVSGTHQSVSLNGLAKNPIVLSDDDHDFGTVLVGETEVKSFTVTNHASSSATLTLEKQVETDDTSAYSLSPTSVPATGVPVAVTLTFAPTAAEHYSANVSSRIGELEVALGVRGKGSLDTVEEGAVQQTFSDDPGALQPSAATRFSVFVPEYSSRLNMGKPSPADAGANPIRINGIGLATTQKVLLNACGTLDDSEIGIQANGNVYIQSNEADVLSLSDGNNVVAAGGAAYVLGDGGVLIATTVDGPTSKGDDDFPNADLSGDSSPLTAAGAAGAFFSAADAFIALCGALRAGRYLTLDSKSGLSKIAAVAAGVTGLTASVISAVGASPAALPAVTIYGHAGVLVGTPGFGGFHCAAGLALTSAYPIMGGLDCEIFGLHGVKVTGRETSLQSLVETTVKSHGKVTISADGKSPPYIPGATAIAGELVGEVEVTGKDNVKLFGGNTYNILIDNLGVDMYAESDASKKGRIALMSNDVVIRVDKTMIKIAKGSVQVLDGKKGKVVVSNGQITLTGAGKEQVTLKSGKIELKSGSSTVRADASGTSLKGSKVMLG
ncbi:MAG: hypothetical protein R3B89_27135 [Polyangiaceae bacterium]